jgi:hypothetical protein
VATQESQYAVTSWWQRRQGGEPAPEIQIDPAAFVSHKAQGLTICFFIYGDWQRCWKFLFSLGLASVVGGPVSTGLLQQPLASPSFTASTKS